MNSDLKCCLVYAGEDFSCLEEQRKNLHFSWDKCVSGDSVASSEVLFIWEVTDNLCSAVGG